jgi:MFS family permease
MRNFYTEMEMTCWSEAKIAYMVNMFVFGFVLGVFLSLLPDKIGRRKTMLIMLPFQIIGSQLCLYSMNYYLTGLGYFIGGLVHSKKFIAYAYHFEISDEKSANIYMSTIIGYDIFTMLIFCAIRLFLTKDMLYAIRVYDIFSLVFLVIFIPIFFFESP